MFGLAAVTIALGLSGVAANAEQADGCNGAAQCASQAATPRSVQVATVPAKADAGSRIQDAFAVLRRQLPMAMTIHEAAASRPASPAPAPKLRPAVTAFATPASAKAAEPSPAAAVENDSAQEAHRSAARSRDMRTGRSAATAPTEQAHHHVAENWFEICSKFKTYDATTHTYRAYGGKVKSCRAEGTVARPQKVAQAAQPQPRPPQEQAPGASLLDFLAAHAGPKPAAPARVAPPPAAASATSAGR